MSQEDAFREFLRTYRKSMGWTQPEAAARWNYSYDTVAAWERGRRIPSTQEIPRLARLLEIVAEKLVEMLAPARAANATKSAQAEENPESQDWEAAFQAWGELQQIFRNRTEFNQAFSYPQMFEGARTIVALGISLNAVALTYSRDKFIESIVRFGTSYTLCFLDPDGHYCTQREEEEGLEPGTIGDLTRVNIRTVQAIRRQIGEVAPEQLSCLSVATYDLPPRFNLYMVDDEFMTVQWYAYGRGEDTPTFVLKRLGSGGLFDWYADAAKFLIGRSKRIEAVPALSRRESDSPHVP